MTSWLNRLYALLLGPPAVIFMVGAGSFLSLRLGSFTGDPFPKSSAQLDGQGKESRNGYPLPGTLHSSGGYRRDGKYHRRQRCHLPGRPPVPYSGCGCVALWAWLQKFAEVTLAPGTTGFCPVENWLAGPCT